MAVATARNCPLGDQRNWRIAPFPQYVISRRLGIVAALRGSLAYKRSSGIAYCPISKVSRVMNQASTHGYTVSNYRVVLLLSVADCHARVHFTYTLPN